MSHLPLLSKDSQQVEFEALLNKSEITLLYFSAHWCGPCKNFTANFLIPFYEEMKSSGKSLEIVYVSLDKNQEQFNEYYSEMPWKAFNFSDSRREPLKVQFDVQGIPSLILVNKFGEAVTKQCRKHVEQMAEDAFEHWTMELKENLKKRK